MSSKRTLLECLLAGTVSDNPMAGNLLIYSTKAVDRSTTTTMSTTSTVPSTTSSTSTTSSRATASTTTLSTTASTTSLGPTGKVHSVKL
jgi:hypothetical protein